MGSTLNDGDPALTKGLQWEGRTYMLDDVDMSSTGNQGQTLRSNRRKKVMVVRNVSGYTMYGKRLVQFEEGALPDFLGRVDGYTAVLSGKAAGVTDEWLPSGGVANNDLFLITIEGPTEILCPLTDADFNGDIDAYAPLLAATAAGTTVGATTNPGGRISNFTVVGDTAGTEAFQAAAYMIGHALSARTTQETTDPGAALLACVCIKQ
jgi:hypothetical protein